jgi:hypothetical protein
MFRRRLRGKSEVESGNNLCESNRYGEWFLLYKLSQNMDTVTFGDLVVDIDQAFRKWDSVKGPEEEVHLHQLHHLEASAPPPSLAQSPVHAHELI